MLSEMRINGNGDMLGCSVVCATDGGSWLGVELFIFAVHNVIVMHDKQGVQRE